MEQSERQLAALPYRQAHRASTAREYRLIAELLGRGHDVAIPVLDDGIDLIVDFGLGVQVKSSKNPKGKLFKAPSHQPTRRDDAHHPRLAVVSFYYEPVGEWWHFPRAYFEQRRHVYVGVGTIAYRDNWSVFEEAT